MNKVYISGKVTRLTMNYCPAELFNLEIELETLEYDRVNISINSMKLGFDVLNNVKPNDNIKISGKILSPFKDISIIADEVRVSSSVVLR